MATAARGRSAGLTIERLWVGADSVGGDARGGQLPAAIRARYPDEFSIPLRLDRPWVIANFVESLDGIVALSPEEGASGGGEISGFSEADRFVMALLRAVADVVVVGAGTVRVGSHHEWTPRAVQPSLAGPLGEWRGSLGLAPQPTTVVVTARGELDVAHRGLSAADVPVVVATTPSGARHLGERPLPGNMRIEVLGRGDTVPVTEIPGLLERLGARLALCEGGPHLFGEFLEAGLVDELFLTLAPQLLGRSPDRTRLALVEGRRIPEGRSRWSRLVSIHRAGDDLFLRYRFDPSD